MICWVYKFYDSLVENVFENQGVYKNHTVLKEMQTERRNEIVFPVVGSELPFLCVMDEFVSGIPVFHHIKP